MKQMYTILIIILLRTKNKSIHHFCILSFSNNTFLLSANNKYSVLNAIN